MVCNFNLKIQHIVELYYYLYFITKLNNLLIILQTFFFKTFSFIFFLNKIKSYFTLFYQIQQYNFFNKKINKHLNFKVLTRLNLNPNLPDVDEHFINQIYYVNKSPHVQKLLFNIFFFLTIRYLTHNFSHSQLIIYFILEQ